MNYHERNRYNMFIKVRQYGVINVADFPPSSVGAIQFATINSIIAKIEELAAQQTGGMGEARHSYVSKDVARENLRDCLTDITRTAKAMEYEITGIVERFRFLRGSNDQKLIATAKSFLLAIDSHQADFIHYGLAPNFVEELSNFVTDFEESLNATTSAQGTHVEATAEIRSYIRQGMRVVGVLDAVIKNVYSHNVGKLAAWTTASNIETAVKSKEKPEPNQ